MQQNYSRCLKKYDALTSIAFIVMLLLSQNSISSENSHVNEALRTSQHYCMDSAFVPDEKSGGTFLDENPTENMMIYGQQFCWKDQSKEEIDGKITEVFKLRCRQPNGKFCYLW